MVGKVFVIVWCCWIFFLLFVFLIGVCVVVFVKIVFFFDWVESVVSFEVVIIDFVVVVECGLVVNVFSLSGNVV